MYLNKPTTFCRRFAKYVWPFSGHESFTSEAIYRKFKFFLLSKTDINLTLPDLCISENIIKRKINLTLFKMGFFGAAHVGGWVRGSHISYNDETRHSSTLRKKNPKNIWITWHTLELCWHQPFFTRNQHILLYQEQHGYVSIAFWYFSF